MFGILLQVISSVFEEISQSFGKDYVQKKRETAWTMGFLNSFIPVVGYLLVVTFIQGWEHMTIQAWPTFLIRCVLLSAQAVTTILAIVIAERSTFGFLRVGSIPLILLIDLMLGVSVSGWQVLGMTFIAGTLLVLSLNHGITKKGIGFVLFSTASAAVQLSLYRYNLTQGNSVEIEQIGPLLCVAATFLYLAWREKTPSPFRSLTNIPVVSQGALHGLAVMVGGYAFLYAPASVLLATGRAGGVIAAILAGHWYFKEKYFVLKIAGFVGCALGIIFLTIGTG
jgi:hypothetical protein